MKKSILLLPVLFFMLFSCNDATDIIQENELPEEEAFVTIDHLRSGLNGVYSAYGPDFPGDAIAFNDLFTDNMRIGPRNNGQGSEEYNFLIQPNSDLPTVMWSNRYATINRINRVLRAYERLYDTFSEEDKQFADHIKGNLLAMRALCHLDLFQYFTVDYKNPAGLSVIKMDFVPENPLQVFPRNTTAEILELIKDDLATSLTFLNNTPGNADIATYNTVFYLRPIAVNFMQCKVALLEGDYTTAQTLATAILATPGFGLSPRNVYPQMFTDANPGESIFKLSRLATNNSISALFYFNSNASGGTDPYLIASKQLFDLFPVTANPANLAIGDIRKSVIFDTSFDEATDFYPIRKYKATTDGPTISDVKLFRASEIKLILAECKARNNDLLGAAEEVLALKTARIAPTPSSPVYGTLNAALTDILLERRKEFAFEGHRYLDLKRIGAEINVGIDRLPEDAFTFNAPTTLSAGDYRFTMPIPTVEISANPTIVQNPNY